MIGKTIEIFCEKIKVLLFKNEKYKKLIFRNDNIDKNLRVFM
jgi:hypothetical protein